MSQNKNPLALVDRDGVVWPWDGQAHNEYLLAAGSRYLFTAAEVAEAKAAHEAQMDEARRVRQGEFSPDVAPAKPKRVGTSKQVRQAVLGSAPTAPVYTGAE